MRRGGSCTGRLALAAGLALAVGTPAQAQSEDGPLLRFGVTTGAQYNTNRTLDAADPGSTTELSTQLDFLARFATPIQSLELSGDVGLRNVSGAEADDLPGGIVNPNVRLRYTRQSRDAQLTANAFYSERDVSASELQFDPVTADFDLLDTSGTQRNFGVDTSLELRRRAPFGLTLSAGFTGVRFSGTNDPDLSDEDRFRAGLRLRFDINPVTQAVVDTRFSTFEDFGDAEGRRDTLSLDASLRRDLANGNLLSRANATDTEDGTRYTLSAGRSFETALWQVTGTVGATREVSGDVVFVGGVDLAHELPRGELTFGFDQSVRSGTDDEEQLVTSINLGYRTQLTQLTSFNAGFSFTDRDATAGGDDGRFATLSLGLQHQLSRDLSLSVALERRVSDEDGRDRIDDNVLRINLRRAFVGRGVGFEYF